MRIEHLACCLNDLLFKASSKRMTSYPSSASQCPAWTCEPTSRHSSSTRNKDTLKGRQGYHAQCLAGTTLSSSRRPGCSRASSSCKPRRRLTFSTLHARKATSFRVCARVCRPFRTPLRQLVTRKPGTCIESGL